MRTLSLIGICILIVTSVAWAGRDRDSRGSDRSEYKSSASSDRGSRGSNDRGSNSSSASSYRPSSTSSVSYRSSGSHSTSSITSHTVTQSSVTSNASATYAPTTRYNRDVKLAEARQSAKTYQQQAAAVSQPSYRPYGGTSSNTQNDVSNPRATGSVTYTPSNHISHRDNSNSTSIGSVTYTPSNHVSYRDNSNTTSIGSATHSTSWKNDGERRSGYYLSGKSYKPDNDNADHGSTIHKSHQGSVTTYRPAENPTTRSLRDAKLGEARDIARANSSYRPSSMTNRDFHITPVRRNYTPRVYHRYTPTRYVAPSGYLPPRHYNNHYYYNSHWTKPCYYGYWAWDYHPSFSHRSLYFYYDLFPFIQITRIIYRDYPTVVYVDRPIYTVYDNYYDFDKYPGLDDTLADVRSAWVSGRFDLIASHVRDNIDIAVLLDGSYDYSVRSGDYLAMTRDAIAGMDTISFVWDKVQRRSNGQVTAFAEHVYGDSGSAHRVYVSYTFQRIGGGYYITEVGTTETAWK